MTYSLEGHTLGVCGCKVLDPTWHKTMSCLCSGDSSKQSCCDSFVAHRIGVGTIDNESVASLILVRLLHDDEQSSTLYLDDRSTSRQRELLIAAFTGRLGGRLSDISLVLPILRAIWLAPMRYQVDTSNRAALWIRDNLIWSGRQIPFSYRQDDN